MLRRPMPRPDSGATFFEYLALGVLAAVIVAGLAVSGLGTTLSDSAGAVVCRIVGGSDCKTQADGRNGDTGDPSAGPSPGDTASPGGDPSLADLQKQADDAQKAADAAAVSPGNIMKQIIDLLKDFIGITDVQECFTEGKISSCLWAALDIGSLFFAVLKIGKFAKAIKGALKLWKDFSKGRKILERANDAAKRAKELLKNRRLACGLPAGLRTSGAPPGRVVHASYAAAAIAPAAPGPCNLNPAQIADELSKAKKTGRAGLRAHESLGGHTIAEHVGKSKRELLDRLKADPRLPSTSSFSSYKTADKAVGKALKDNDQAIKNWLAGKDKGFRLTRVPADGKLGISVARDGTSKVAKNVTVVLQRDASSPDGYRILTSYPEA
jgi:hypothetical protein